MIQLVRARSRTSRDVAVRALVGASVASVVALGALVASPRPVLACSCAGFQSMADHAAPENAVFTGIAGAREPRGVPVQIDQWLWGAGAAPVVWLSDESFGDSGMCGADPPPAGTSWIWVTWRPANERDFGTGLCQPQARLDSPEGREMLAEAIEFFGGGAPPGTAAPTEPAAAPAEPTSGASGIPVFVPVAVGVAVATALLFGGLVLVSRRQRPS